MVFTVLPFIVDPWLAERGLDSPLWCISGGRTDNLRRSGGGSNAARLLRGIVLDAWGKTRCLLSCIVIQDDACWRDCFRDDNIHTLFSSSCVQMGSFFPLLVRKNQSVHGHGLLELLRFHPDDHCAHHKSDARDEKAIRQGCVQVRWCLVLVGE